MKINHISEAIEEMAPLQIQEEYDNSGLIIGHPGKDIRGVLISVDVTENVVTEAYEKGCDLIISHHPLLFKELKKVLTDTRIGRLIELSIQKNIAIYAAHTNLDNGYGGVSWIFGEKLGLKKIEVLDPKKGILKKLVTFCPTAHLEQVRQALFDAGCGTIGNYDSCSFNSEGKGTFRGLEGSEPFVGEKENLHTEDEIRVETIFPAYLEQKVIMALKGSHPYEEVAYDIYSLSNVHPRIGTGITGEFTSVMHESEFLSTIKEVTGIPFVRHSGFTGRKIRKVALCGGAGRFLLGEIPAKGVDAFLTADLTYHDFFESGNRFLLVDTGHYESEQFAKEVMYNTLVKKFPNFVVLISEQSTNGVHYY